MNNADVSLLILRLVFGIFMFAHGANKVRGGLAGTARWFAGIGMRYPMAQARVAAFTEMGAGLMLAAGLFTPLACAGVAGVMTVAIVTVHMKVGFFIFLPEGGWEYCASILAVAVALALSGPGRFSIDHLLSFDAGTPGSVAGAAGGILLALLHLLLTYRPAGKSS